MDEKTVEKYKEELVSAWMLAGLGSGARAGIFTGLGVIALAVLGGAGSGEGEELSLMKMSAFLAFTTAVGGVLGAMKGMNVGARKKITVIEDALRNNPKPQ